MCRFPKCPEEGVQASGTMNCLALGLAAELGSCGGAAGSPQLLSLCSVPTPILSVVWPALHTWCEAAISLVIGFSQLACFCTSL